MYSCPYQHDANLDPDFVILRAVHPDFVEWESRDASGMPMMQSRVFQEASAALARDHGYVEPAVSIGFERTLFAEGSTLDDFLGSSRSNWGIASLLVRHVRSISPEVGVIHDRKGEVWHGILFGVTRLNMKSEKNALRDCATLIRAPHR